MTEFKKGDPLRITIEAKAITSGSTDDGVIDIDVHTAFAGFFPIYPEQIRKSGGTVTVEVLPKPVELPTKKYAQVLVCENGKERLATLMTLDEVRPPCPWWVEAEHWTTELVKKLYVRTISEGVDE